MNRAPSTSRAGRLIADTSANISVLESVNWLQGKGSAVRSPTHLNHVVDYLLEFRI